MGCNGMPFFSSNFLIQTQEDEHQHPQHHQPPTSLNPYLPSCSPHNFHGIASLLGKRATSFSGIEHICDDVIMNVEEDLSDDGLSNGGEKKRRLNIDQVKTLEKTFEQGNKLEPDRKIQLARALGLQPRQIAIWFQNRRARWKTKQLEKDYNILKRHFDSVKADNDSLIAQNQKLHAQIVTLRRSRDHPDSINLNKETIIDQGSSSGRSDNSSDHIHLDISRTPEIDSSPNVPISIPLFPTSSKHHTTSAATNTGEQLIFAAPSSRPDHYNHQLMSHYHQSTNNNGNQNQHVKEESFNNVMFCGMEDQTGSLWPWLEQQQQHFN